MPIVRQTLPYGIVHDVQDLIAEIFLIRHAMRMIAFLPNLPCHVFSNGKGKSPFDELRTSLYRYIRRRRKNGVEVIWHNDKGMEFKLAGVAITKDGLDA